MCLCREKPGFKDHESVSKSIEKSSFTARNLIGDNSGCFPFTQIQRAPHAMMCPRCAVGGHGSKSQLYKRPLLLGTSHSRPPKNRKIPHIFGTTQGSKRFHIRRFKFKPRNMHLKDSFDESVWCFTCFCWWGFGGKMLKCFKVFLERKRGPTTNGCYKNPLLGPLHLGHPQTANCQFRKLDIRQFLVCHKWGTLFFSPRSVKMLGIS